MWAIGNGESRRNININILEGPKVGCNAIYRDHYTDYLICVDRRMMQEAIKNNANQDRLLYTRENWFDDFRKDNKKIRVVPELPYVGSDRWDEPFQWGSGPYAVLVASKYAKEKQVGLVGFDLFSKTNKVNNLYKGTNNYINEDKRAVDPRYWIHQIGMVFRCFPKINYKLYVEDNWQLPKFWKIKNVSLDKISNIV